MLTTLSMRFRNPLSVTLEGTCNWLDSMPFYILYHKTLMPPI